MPVSACTENSHPRRRQKQRHRRARNCWARAGWSFAPHGRTGLAEKAAKAWACSLPGLGQVEKMEGSPGPPPGGKRRQPAWRLQPHARGRGTGRGLPSLGGRGAPFRPGARAAIAQYRPGSGRPGRGGRSLRRVRIAGLTRAGRAWKACCAGGPGRPLPPPGLPAGKIPARRGPGSGGLRPGGPERGRGSGAGAPGRTRARLRGGLRGLVASPSRSRRWKPCCWHATRICGSSPKNTRPWPETMLRPWLWRRCGATAPCCLTAVARLCRAPPGLPPLSGAGQVLRPRRGRRIQPPCRSAAARPGPAGSRPAAHPALVRPPARMPAAAPVFRPGGGPAFFRLRDHRYPGPALGKRACPRGRRGLKGNTAM